MCYLFTWVSGSVTGVMGWWVLVLFLFKVYESVLGDFYILVSGVSVKGSF